MGEGCSDFSKDMHHWMHPCEFFLPWMTQLWLSAKNAFVKVHPGIIRDTHTPGTNWLVGNQKQLVNRSLTWNWQRVLVFYGSSVYMLLFLLCFFLSFLNHNLCYHCQFMKENTIESNHFRFMFNSDLLIPCWRQTVRFLKDPVDPWHSMGLLLTFFWKTDFFWVKMWHKIQPDYGRWGSS